MEDAPLHFLQQWFNLSDPQAEDSLYDSESMRRPGSSCQTIGFPDETTILPFRHLLEEHKLTEALLGGGARNSGDVDATILEAPPSTKNAEKPRGLRDLEMRQTKKGNQ